MDVLTALLNPDVEEEIYIQVLQGLEVPEEFKKGAPALRLLKGLDGLKQAPGLDSRKEKVSSLSSLFMLMILS